MDLTQGTANEKIKRAKKTMMWFGMVSMCMTFAGLTSAYVVSKSRGDWTAEIQFPNEFLTSLFVIIASSLTLHFVKKAIKNNQRSLATTLLVTTLVLGVIFVFLQFQGFENMMGQGYHFTGPTSNIVSTFMFIIVATHLVHITGGILVLCVITYNQICHKYQQGKTLGLELGTMFWHFVDILWIYLFFFLYFVR